METLPETIQHAILSYPHYDAKDLTRIAAVCKKWYPYGHDEQVWETLYKKAWDIVVREDESKSWRDRYIYRWCLENETEAHLRILCYKQKFAKPVSKGFKPLADLTLKSFINEAIIKDYLLRTSQLGHGRITLRYYSKEALKLLQNMAILNEWSQISQGPEGTLDIVSGAILVSELIHGPIDRQKIKMALEQLEQEAMAHLGECENPKVAHKIIALHTTLFTEHAFHGNDVKYYKAENHSIIDVLENGYGAPGILAVIYTELGTRMGLEMEIVSLPHYTIVKVISRALNQGVVGGVNFNAFERDAMFFVDPFRSGQILTKKECRALIESMDVKFEDIYFKKIGCVDVWSEMLKRLSYIYKKENNVSQMIKCLEHLLHIAPECSAELLLYSQVQMQFPYKLEEVIETLSHLIDLKCSHSLPIGMVKQLRQFAIEKVETIEKSWHRKHSRVQNRLEFENPPKFQVGMMCEVKNTGTIGIIRGWSVLDENEQESGSLCGTNATGNLNCEENCAEQGADLIVEEDNLNEQKVEEVQYQEMETSPEQIAKQEDSSNTSSESMVEEDATEDSNIELVEKQEYEEEKEVDKESILQEENQTEKGIDSGDKEEIEPVNSMDDQENVLVQKFNPGTYMYEVIVDPSLESEILDVRTFKEESPVELNNDTLGVHFRGFAPGRGYIPTICLRRNFPQDTYCTEELLNFREEEDAFLKYILKESQPEPEPEPEPEKTPDIEDIAEESESGNEPLSNTSPSGEEMKAEKSDAAIEINASQTTITSEADKGDKLDSKIGSKSGSAKSTSKRASPASSS
eukprot:Nk52_evm23s914 gene=Nk52_evmTU23s914